MSTKVVAGLNAEVRQLTADEVMEHAAQLAHVLAPAFERAAGEMDVWGALKLCALGKMQCFVGAVNEIINTAMITNLTDYPLIRVCDVVAYAGRARDFYWFNEELEKWAMDNGASEMRGYGPEAAMRLAKHHGYTEIYRVYKKTLTRKEQE